MKALAFNEFGGPDKLKLRDVPDPKIKPTEVLVRVRACALNHLAEERHLHGAVKEASGMDWRADQH